MKKHLFMLLTLLCFGTAAWSQMKIDVPYFVELFNQGKFTQLYNEACSLRAKKEFGKMAILDFFIAKSLCATRSYATAGKAFRYILTEYPLTPKQKFYIEDEYGNCKNAQLAASLKKDFHYANFKLVSTPNLPVARVAGKMGYVLDCKSDPEAYKFNPDFDRGELEKRLFKIDELQNAVSYYKNYYSGYNVTGSGRFIFITLKPYNLSTADVKQVADKLERVYNFFYQFYQIRRPDKLIAVYLMRDKETLRATAMKAHGLTLPESNIGYSSLDDLSILANSDAENIGTIFHELFHLMVRTDVGDIPAWLDEGIACLYETSTLSGTTLKGNVQNWRTTVLKENLKANNQLPKLKTIVNENWGGFILNDSNTACVVALNYAVAKHFAIYMQEHNLLQKMVAAFKNRKNVFTDTLAQEESALSLVEKASGKKIDDLQKAFDKWLDEVYKIKKLDGNVQPLDRRFMIARDQLETYKYSGGTQVVNSKEYKDLSARYQPLQDSLEAARRSRSNTEQAGPDTYIPDDLKNRINKFIQDVGSFSIKYPLH